MNCIYQYWIDVTGKENKTLNISNSSVNSYAKKYNCEYISDTKYFHKVEHSKNYYKYLFNWIRVIYDDYFDQFDNVLYLDSDMIITKYAENIFNEVQKDDVFLCCKEYPQFTPIIDKNVFFPYTVLEEEGILDKYESDGVWPNTGMMIFTRKFRQLAKKYFNDIDTYHHPDVYKEKSTRFINYDEFYMLCMLLKYDIKTRYLDRQWNSLVEFEYTKYFYHFNNSDIVKQRRKQLELIKEHVCT